MIWPVLVAVTVAVLIGFFSPKELLWLKLMKPGFEELTVVTIISGVFYVLYLSNCCFYKIKEANAVSSLILESFHRCLRENVRLIL